MSDVSPRSRRRALQSATAAVVVALLLWWLLPLGGTSRPSGRVVLSTGVSTGVYEKYGTLLRADLRRDLPDVTVRLLPSQGSVDNVQRLVRGDASYAIATADAVATYTAEGGPGADRLRACARLYDDYMHLVVPRDSAVRSARDLRGLRVGVGEDRSGVQLITRRLLTAAGLGMGDIRARRVGIDRMTRLTREGKLDAFFWSGGLPTAALQDLSERMPVRLVPLADLIEPLHRQGERSRYYRAAVMPADAYPRMGLGGEAVKTIAVANLLVTTDRADTRLTEQLTRTVIRSRDRIGAEVHAAQRVDLRTAVFTDPLQLHAGAARYYRSVKP
ncbi:TAXI family TRAP transporter solute-binding subunit [Streptomyces palmae]|uniref:TAXI family TRAP transporter solute-binding subunit n=1 Tax=Streptomyces palmae TaxID=1701085 RepID=A0A4Z0H5Y3_9ACTN|nr:TAXI family TRAP transporter solute-binding subunit [Streptomyces palmae]TGB07577.1 TAXI family TRAP transporter solute-binding subunit [Streptomyces palmae]